MISEPDISTRRLQHAVDLLEVKSVLHIMLIGKHMGNMSCAQGLLKCCNDELCREPPPVPERAPVHHVPRSETGVAAIARDRARRQMNSKIYYY